MARAVENGHDVDPGAAVVVQVACGESHTLALSASGSVYTWGRGQFGRMGMGVFQDELVPTLVEIGMSAEEEESPSIREDGTSGAQNNWDMAERSRFTQIAAGSYHSLALGGDGTVWSWGFNAYGQLGRQKGASYPAPVTFSCTSTTSYDESRKYTTSRNQDTRNADGSTIKVTMVEAGGMMSSAIDQEGGLWLWGAVPQPSAIAQSPLSPQSHSFELANINKPERVLAFTGHKVRRVSCGSEHILALVDDRNAVQCYAWGGNANGQLGLGDFETRDIPTKVASLAVQQVGIIVDFACGFYHSVVITAKDGESSDQESESFYMARKNPQLMDQVMASSKLRGRITGEQYMESLGSPRVRSKQGYPYSVPNGNTRSNNRSFSVHSDTSSRGLLQSSVSSWAGNSVRAQVARREAQLPVSGGGDGRLSSCWTFGQGENGQLGNGSRANSHTPAIVEALPTHERIQAVACGLFHIAVVTESGDVWVWGMEGGLGQCPGIGPPGSKSGDALTPVRVFGESSARCNLMSGLKGIACGAAHTVTVANGGKDLWAWGKGKNGVLGLGHASDSWFPSPVMWPPGTHPSGSKDMENEGLYDVRKSSRASSRGGSRGRGDEIRPYAREVDDIKPPRSTSFSRLPGEQQYLQEVREVEVERPPRGVPTHRKAMESPGRPRRDPVMESPGRPTKRDPVMHSPVRPSRRGDQFWPPVQSEPENPRAFRRVTGSEPSSTSMRAFKYQIEDSMQAEDVMSLKLELAECRRYAESLHVAVYGGLETFALPLPGNNSSLYDSGFASRNPANGPGTKSSVLQDWHLHVDEAPLEELVKLEHFYKGMRNRLKDILFQRKMEDWCRRVQTGFSAASYQDPPPVREPYSVQSTPYFNDPGELALRMSGILSDRGEMLPPAALAASIAEFRTHSQRRR